MPESILRRIAEGDRAAVRECIARYGGLVWSMARRLSCNSADAEDAVQEVFIDLWKHAGRFDPSIASEPTFVVMLARRTIIDRMRKRARQGESVPLPDDLTARSGDGPIEELARRDEIGRAARALRQLGEKQRQVLTLSIYHGLTYDQIAKFTGLPLGTVKTHARRGLIQLRRELGESNDGDDVRRPVQAAPISSGGDA